MKYSYLYILLANLWLMTSYLVEDTTRSFFCIIVALAFLGGFLFSSFAERKMMDLDFKLDKFKRHYEDLKHEEIIKLLETIAGKKKNPRKKTTRRVIRRK